MLGINNNIRVSFNKEDVNINNSNIISGIYVNNIIVNRLVLLIIIIKMDGIGIKIIIINVCFVSEVCYYKYKIGY